MNGACELLLTKNRIWPHSCQSPHFSLGHQPIHCLGSGKTIVAWHIIKTYLERDDRKKAPVLMFTPGGALATQQSDRLKKYLPKDST